MLGVGKLSVNKLDDPAHDAVASVNVEQVVYVPFAATTMSFENFA
jgi:hypothetical protein